ncbi:MAG: type II secretion system protein [Pyrinomonadaceae bacterium]
MQKAEGRRKKAEVGAQQGCTRGRPTANCLLPFSFRGFTLLELVITVTVLSILTLGVIPLVKVSVKRQKEQQLRETLREMRMAIDQFHREAIAAPLVAPGADPRAAPPPQPADPRIRVYVSDQTIFTVDNPDRFPPSLETLVSGVDVLPFATGVMGGRGSMNVNATDVGSQQLTAKKKIYLRHIPDDPTTPQDESKGEAEWGFRSCYDSPDSNSWGGENVFDVYSKSTGTALNGEKYSDW